MTRKSPYKHHVRKHIRKGKPVHDYDRGKGNKPSLIRPFSIGGSTPYIVKVTYPDTSSETVNVSSSGRNPAPIAFRNALNIGVEMRRLIKPPKIISVRRRKR